MLRSLVLSLLGLLAAASAAAIPVKRDTESLYVYGTGLDGLPLQATANGSILVTQKNVTSSFDLYDVVLTTDSIFTPWTATLSKNGSVLSGFEFFINPSADAFSPIGLVLADLADTLSSLLNIVTTGFFVYGGTVQYLDGLTLSSQFWARSISGTNGTYQILWNSNGDIQPDSVPVVLRTDAPAVLDRA